MNKLNHVPTLGEIMKDPRLRIPATQKDFLFFINVYFANHIPHLFADFHKEWIRLAQDESIHNILVSAFRDSGKSTILSQLFPMWAVTGKLKIKNILLVTHSVQKAEQILRSIKREFEENLLLKRDLGPFEERPGLWNSRIIHIKKYTASIQILSTDQNPRSLKDGISRPQLIIADDLESLDTIKTQAARDELYNWYKSELVLAGAQNARYIFIGTPLHSESVFSRLKREIESSRMNGVISFIPIVDCEGNPTWPSKYPTKESVEKEKLQKGIPEYTWRTELMLETPTDQDQIIRPERIRYYDPREPREGALVSKFISVDPAGTANPNSDYSGVIVFSVWRVRDQKIVYVEEVYNKKLWNDELIVFLVNLSKSVGNIRPAKIFIEEMPSGISCIPLFEKEGVPAEAIHVGGRNKRERVINIAVYVERGVVLFPKSEGEPLVLQLTQLGVGPHDDLVDAFTQGVEIALRKTHGYLEMVEQDLHRPKQSSENNTLPITPQSLGQWVAASRGKFWPF